MLRPRLWKWATAVSIVAVGGYFLLPGTPAKDVAYVVIGVVSSGWIWVGVRLHQPAERLAWYLLMVANLLSAAADFIENVVYGLILQRAVPFPSVADAFYLAAYPLTFIAIVRLCRNRDEAGSRENYADAAIIGLAALALSWHFLISSDFHASGVDLFGRVVTMAYPMMDLALLFIIVRALVFGSGRMGYHRLLAAAVVSELVADFIYDIMVLHGTYATGNAVDAGWLINYCLCGVAALHPSISAARPARTELPDARRRIPVLAMAGFVAPGVLLVASATGASVDVPVIAGTSIALFALVSLRMSWLFQRIRAQTVQARANAAALQEAVRTQELLESDLRYQAFHDALTGLANRALLQNRVGHSLLGSARSQRLVALCFCDLDGFKTVNDSLGHQYGDDLLKVTSARLRSVVRAGDTVARLGGDEFAVLMDDIASVDEATAAAERIVAVMREPIEMAGRQIAMSISVGVAFAGPTTTAEQLLSEADTAMYEAKARGKSRWEIFQASMSSRSLERLELTNSFRGSLERGEFVLHFQPHFSLSDGRLEGCEALVRWLHPTRGWVGPNQFIPLAEETGFIVPLGRWVLESACEHAARWFSDRRPDMTISVNLSGRQLEDRNLADDVRTALAISGLPARCLQLEVTESSLLVDSEEATATLAALKTLGIKLALDDFGTGYSSLSYLRRLPLDLLKIDKSFVDPLCEPGEEGPALMSTIIEFARILKLQTVAEGIEYPAQLELLAELGCDSAQGFLLARPMDAEEVSRFISNPVPGYPLSERSLPDINRSRPVPSSGRTLRR